ARRPVGCLGHRLDHRPLAWIFRMREAEFDRVDGGRGRELVHEGFDREHVGIGSKRTQRRSPDWIVYDQVMGDLVPRQVVARNGVAVAGSVRLRGLARRPRLMRLCHVPAASRLMPSGSPGRMLWLWLQTS